jgi:hypothetical protein
MVTARRELHPLHSRPERSNQARLLLESLTATVITINPAGEIFKEAFDD